MLLAFIVAFLFTDVALDVGVVCGAIVLVDCVMFLLFRLLVCGIPVRTMTSVLSYLPLRKSQLTLTILMRILNI